MEQAIEFYTQTLGLKLTSREDISSFHVEAAFLQANGDASETATTIELISPLNEKSTLVSFLEKRGEGLHHFCFRVPSVTDELLRLNKLGVKLIDKEPRVGAHGKDVAFLHPHAGFGALIELCSEASR